MANSETVLFNGIKFRRYPDSERRSDRVYFTPGVGDKERGIGRLHQEIWKAANGPIPDGHHVHHKDGDPLNNSIDNLECLPGVDHLHHHLSEIDHHTPERLAHMERIRPLASEWHRSPAGREWHREHAKSVAANRSPETRKCDHCGKDYEGYDVGHAQSFCSNYCKHRARLASGVDDEDRTCEFCGNPFRVNKYLRKRCCTRSCGARLSRRTESERRLQPAD